MSNRNNSIDLGDIGLPPVTLNARHIFKSIRQTRQNNGIKLTSLRKSVEVKDSTKSIHILTPQELDLKNKGVDPYNLSPSSPLKHAKFNRRNLVPYQSMNKKTYFKTLEHMI
jgi:hypothetical protein